MGAFGASDTGAIPVMLVLPKRVLGFLLCSRRYHLYGVHCLLREFLEVLLAGYSNVSESTTNFMNEKDNTDTLDRV